MQPTVGRIVHYKDGDDLTVAAIITAVHPDQDAQPRLLDIPLSNLVTDADGNVLNEREAAVDSDGEPIYEGGTSQGDVALIVFGADGVVRHVPIASEHFDPDPDDKDGMGEPQAVGTWVWPPRI